MPLFLVKPGSLNCILLKLETDQNGQKREEIQFENKCTKFGKLHFQIYVYIYIQFSFTNGPISNQNMA